MTIRHEFEAWARKATPSLHVFSFARTWDHPNGESYLELATELAFQAYKARSLEPVESSSVEMLERELRVARHLFENFRTRLGESKEQIGDCVLSGETDFFLKHCKPDQAAASKYEFQVGDDFVSFMDDTMHTATINIKEAGETHWSAIAVHGTGKTQAVARRDHVLSVLQAQAQQNTKPFAYMQLVNNEPLRSVALFEREKRGMEDHINLTYPDLKVSWVELFTTPQSQAQQESPKTQFLDRSKEKIITLLWQGRTDGTVEAFDVNGMMAIPSEEGVTYVRKEDAINFFGLTEQSQAQQEANPTFLEEIDELIANSTGVAGLHKNGEVATWDWLMGNGWISLPQQEPENNSASNAAIEYALNNHDLEFLREWPHGNFDAIRKEWTNAPEAVFIGADPLHPKTKGVKS